MWKIQFLLICLFLLGCNTTPIEQLPYDELVKLSNKFEATCKSMGLKPNSEQYKQCYFQEARAEQLRRNKLQENLNTTRMVFKALGDAASAAAPPPRRTVHCTSMPMLITTEITCQ